ncbi:hypothetical protein GQ55_3G213800 [Panicum hallii var. hallii]|uniref:Uncharacterized protein n=1 Tax=Panicum hallii var. hallii TaxID=1504633 RepID=A0A2T7EBX4_9POAL|nr:hypothetical protein GQ55_3G213800 [Panicum hallii var. hallii]
MATKPYFLWGDTHAASAAASDSDAAAVFGSRAPETATLLAASTAAGDTAAVSPEIGAAAVARPRMRRNSSGSGKQQQPGGGGAKKPPQRGLGVAELERLRCGGDPLRELVADAAGAQGYPLLHYHQQHLLQVPPSAFDSAAGARYCSQLLAPAPPPPPGPAPVCFLHTPAAASCQRAPLVALEQQYFRDRWGRMGGFPTAGNGSGGGADHQPQLLPATLAPEHPSSQNTIWRPAASSCLHTGHRCDICCRRMRALAERGALAPTPPASPNAAGSNTNATPDYSIYDLAAAMATARQGDTFLALDRKGGAPAAAEAPAKEEVREIEFFPAASAHHTGSGGRVSVRGDSELAAPFSSPYGAAAGRTAPQLDLSLRL